MENFGGALKKARISRKATLREVGENIGISIGYISDIEHNRKRPPDLEIVSKIEDFLGIKDGSLIKLAKIVRKNMRRSLPQRLKKNPKLSTVLLRAENLPEHKRDAAMDKLLETLRQFEEEP
ncbi:MAG: helix-turn-helix transcriptional regulator [Desulfosarcina sp.]|nr:helix-turn-helix transcriptional regulator [Desulfosarcina sp.]MBC2742853.1 helix-turn-helix transcriptional regulator [Desulfosarcina sp.]MBC2765763.1 helix-turn-helix transcriptional regulator [Desulfosarcina sp.]